MNSNPHLFARGQRFAKRKLLAVFIAAIAGAMISVAPADAGSAAASFQVTVQVVRGCHVTTGSGGQSPVNVNCGQTPLPSAPSATPGSSTKTEPVIETSQSADGTQLVTVNF